jgi:ribosomal protein S6--L-glutamate ligase
MKPTIVVVNGERDWHSRFPDAEVVYGRLQDCAWVLRDGELWYVDRDTAVRVGGVFWRVGAIRPSERHRTALEIIRLGGVPCVNPAEVLLRGFDRLSMLAELRAAGLPVVPFDVAIGDDMARRLGRKFPLVVKAGNHHAGLGKMRVVDQTSWGDVADLLFAVEEYVTVEPYIAYRRDVRCLAIGERYWAMEREGRGWKANVDTRKYRLIEPPEELVQHTRAAVQHLRADTLALDFLEQDDGRFVVLESNDTPGLSGFPDEVRAALAECLKRRM